VCSANNNIYAPSLDGAAIPTSNEFRIFFIELPVVRQLAGVASMLSTYSTPSRTDAEIKKMCSGYKQPMALEHDAEGGDAMSSQS
jgi:hypothetical protein